MNTLDLEHLLHTLHHSQEERISTLVQWCEINTGTENIVGIAKLQEQLIEAFQSLHPQVEHVKFSPIPMITMSGETIEQEVGPALLFRKRPDCEHRLLLCGHLDTVYPEVSPFQKVTLLNNNTLNGPGVADMKGGLLIILEALKHFEQLPCAKNLGWDVIINCDEEIGSPASGPYLEHIAKNYIAALVYEPAMTPEGTLAKNRRGSGKFTVIAKGKAAHAGRSFQEGRNAICYLAEALLKIHALNHTLEGVSLNVGKISGGTALNVIPDTAVAKIDVRITDAQQAEQVLQAFELIKAHLKREGYDLHFIGQFGRPVKKVCAKTEALFQQIKMIGQRLGLNIDWQDSGGCCDGNNLSQSGLPVIDTLGVRGGNIHSHQEYLLIDSFIERIALTVLLLESIAMNIT